MSKTTLRKRIAIVAVSALTAGVISAVTAVPANAGIQTSTNAAPTDTTLNVALLNGSNSTGAVVLDGTYTGFKSLGLYDKDASSTTAQTATMLSTGSLVLYTGAAGTATHTAMTASGGTFGATRATTSGNATYSASLKTVFFVDLLQQLQLPGLLALLVLTQSMPIEVPQLQLQPNQFQLTVL